MLPVLIFLLALCATAATAKPTTYGCPIAGISAVCPAFSRARAPRSLEKAGVTRRIYAPGVYASLKVNASSFGSAAASTYGPLSSYQNGANERGFQFHDTAPSLLRFNPTKDLTSCGRAFVASRFLDVREAADAPPPTSNAEVIKICKAKKADVWVANFTSASPFPGPPTAATALGHLRRLASELEAAGEHFCARSAWLLSYSPDSMATGRKYFEVSVDAGKCGEEEEGGEEGVCPQGEVGEAPSLHLGTE